MSATTVDPGKLLTPGEVAKMLGVAEQTLSVWRITGRYNLRFTKVGRCVRYKLSDVVRWLDGNTATSTGEITGETTGRMDDD